LVNWNTPITPQDRRAMARLASSLPKGSPERRAILAGLSDQDQLRNLLLKADWNLRSADGQASYSGDREAARKIRKAISLVQGILKSL